jgi:hypothetical protein
MWTLAFIITAIYFIVERVKKRKKPSEYDNYKKWGL